MNREELIEEICCRAQLAHGDLVRLIVEAVVSSLALFEKPQPEPEYEYSWEGVDDEGDDWIMDEWFATVAGAERYADSRMGNWVRTDNGKLIRRVKAGAWEPAPNQEGEQS